MQGAIRFGLTLAVLILLGYFVAAASGDVSVQAFNESPAVGGKFSVQFELAFTLVVGWAVGVGMERMWEDERDDWRADCSAFAEGALPRFFGGVALWFVVIGIEFGFEALGVGLG